MDTMSLLVVGGGIIGHLVAWRACAAHPAVTVGLVERDIPGGGAAARSAGLHFPLGRSPSVRAMSLESQRFYEAALRISPDLPIFPLDLRIHCSEVREDWLRAVMTEGASLVREAAPNPVSQALGSAIPVWTAVGAHRADVSAVVRAIRLRLADRLRVFDGMKVCSIEEDNAIVQVVTQDGSALAAERVLLAPGPWALDSPFLPFVDPLGVRVKKVIAFHLNEPLQERPCIDLFIEDDAFLMPRPAGGRLFSFTRLDWDVSPDEVARGITASDRAEAEAVIERVAPRLKGQLSGGQLFCDAYSPDGVPIAAPVGSSGRVVFAGAGNGSGYRLAPAIARAALAALDMPLTSGSV